MRSEIIAYCENVLDPELRALRAERDRLAQLYAIRRHWRAAKVRDQGRAADMDIALYRWIRDESERARAYGREQGLRGGARVSVA